MFDWPLFAVVGIVLLIFLFRSQIGKILDKDLTFVWNGTTVMVKNLGQDLDMELEPIKDDIQGIRSRLLALEARLATSPGDLPTTATESAESPDDDPDRSIRGLMLEELRTGRFQWRSVERLAAAAGTSNDEATRILRETSGVRLS